MGKLTSAVDKNEWSQIVGQRTSSMLKKDDTRKSKDLPMVL